MSELPTLEEQFGAWWASCTLPGEFDAMDQCDQQRWRGVALDAFMAGAALGAWQPIETAPKDEPVQLAWRNWAGEWVIAADVAVRSNTCPPGSGLSNASAHGSATYWRPLPAPPEDNTKARPRELTHCGYCLYEEANGELLEQCAKCKAADAPLPAPPEAA